MLNHALSVIQQVSVHFIGNPQNGEQLRLSENPLELYDEHLHTLLRTYFLSNFTTPEYHSFTFSNEDFTLNPLYQFAAEVFGNPETLHENAVNIAKHLFASTQHPNIKAGELYVAFIRGIEIDNTVYAGLGIFKSENKENYLKLSRDFDLNADEGINIRKLDKGCLILDTEHDAGYKVLIVDNI